MFIFGALVDSDAEHALRIDMLDVKCMKDITETMGTAKHMKQCKHLQRSNGFIRRIFSTKFTLNMSIYKSKQVSDSVIGLPFHDEGLEENQRATEAKSAEFQ